MIPLEEASEQLADHEALRGILERSGYLFLRGLLGSEPVARTRRAVAELLTEEGWIGDATGADLTVRAEAMQRAHAQHGDVFNRAFRLEAVHALGHALPLTALMSGLLKAPILVHPRPFIRLVLPTSSERLDTTTAAHQDFVSQQGSLDTLTAWMPLHEVALECGPLALAEKSHLNGVLPFRLGRQPGSMEVADPLTEHWRASQLRQGDVIIFHSLTAHKALPNLTRGLRLSVDVRYQRLCDPVNAQCLELGGLPYSWDDLYSAWGEVAPRHYWRDFELKYRPFDPSYHQERDEMALAMAEAGDPRALPELRRLMQYKNHASSERAAALLARFEREADQAVFARNATSK